jgi:hypothetical protein
VSDLVGRYVMLNQKIILVVILAFVFGCVSKPEVTQLKGLGYEKSVKDKLNGILNECAGSTDIGTSMLADDTIEFKISSNGAALGVAYKSPTTISKAWAYCIDGHVKETKFDIPPRGQAYSFLTEVPWDEILKSHPVLLTDRVKIKKAIRDNEPFFKVCYENYVKNGGKQQGKVNLQVEASAKGVVKFVRCESSQMTMSL